MLLSKNFHKFSLITLLIINSNAFGKHENYGTQEGFGRSTTDEYDSEDSDNRHSGDRSNYRQGSSSAADQSFNSAFEGSSRGSSKHRKPIRLAVKSRRTIEMVPVNFHGEEIEPQIIEISSNSIPLKLYFRSKSSSLTVHQTHTPSSPQKVEETSFEDEPYRILHRVVKPVIQEVREVIQPYRNIVQQVKPVIEHVNTIISKEDHKRSSDSDDSSKSNHNLDSSYRTSGGRSSHNFDSGGYETSTTSSVRNSQNIGSGNFENSRTSGSRSSHNFDSSYSHKASDSDISQSYLNYGSDSGIASTNGYIYTIAPLNTGFYNRKRADFNRRYLRIYPLLRF